MTTDEPPPLPVRLALNAFAGGQRPVTGRLAEAADRWGSGGDELGKQAPLAPEDEISPARWKHPDVGWGVVLADRDDVADEEKARGADAPEPIRRLIAERGDAPVFRYRADLSVHKLARYLPGGARQDAEIGLTPFGTGRGRIPLYLLICGSPAEVPWRLQYSLNRRHHVGRLDLPADGLRNYVDALRSGWSGMDTVGSEAVLWSVSNDSMTRKMELTVAAPIHAAMTRDSELTVTRINGDGATHAPCAPRWPGLRRWS